MLQVCWPFAPVMPINGVAALETQKLPRILRYMCRMNRMLNG